MALSVVQKQRIFDLLAAGKTATQTAEDVGCSRGTVQRLKRDSRNNPLLKTAQAIATEKRLTEDSGKVLIALAGLKEREPAIQEGLWGLFNGLNTLFSQVIEQTDPADISPRQLPALAKAAADIATAYADYADRVNGLEVLADEIEKINAARTA